MFDTDVVGLDAAGTLAAVQANEHTFCQAEVRRLALAAHWADLHPGDMLPPGAVVPGAERPVQVGGAGTPEVADFCPAELGPMLRMSAGSARRLIADALDLRHRLPRCWAAARAGQVPGYQARFIARGTRHLTVEQARSVDAEITPALGAVPFGRLKDLLTAAVYAADPATADREAARAAAERFVRLGRDTEHGLRLIIARATAGDAVWFHATIDRIADILTHHGDLDPVEVRRSKAIGILAQPAEALRLLCDHQDDPDEEAEPDEPDQPDPADPAEAGSRSLRIGPPPFDPAKARPRAVLYVHLSEQALTAGHGVCRVEDHGPVLVSRLGQLLGDRVQIIVKPVLNLNHTPAPVDGYEFTAEQREHLMLRQPVDTFPYAAGGSRRTDIDHPIPYLPPGDGGPAGQTGLQNAAPLSRFHHRVKTFSRWRLRQPDQNTRVWRSPSGWIYVVNPTGTHPMGNTPYAHAIWDTATGPPSSHYEIYTPRVDIVVDLAS